MLPAVCVLIQHHQDKDFYIAVSRRDDPSHWGLPGGKDDDEHESNIEAAQRECNEEIGILAALTSFEPMYVGLCPGDVNFWVTTYAFMDPEPIHFDELVAEKGLVVEWKSEQDLCDPKLTPFAAYNVEVFKSLRNRWPSGVIPVPGVSYFKG
jgi:8-oxo-dGTP pyrophosphatase MutT (NUDIX family)